MRQCVDFSDGGNFAKYGRSFPGSRVFLLHEGNTAYPDQYESSCRFKEGSLIHFRPIRPDDAALLLELFHSHSEQTLIHRYFIPLHELSHEMLERFVSVDYRNDMAIIGLIPFADREKMICVGRTLELRAPRKRKLPSPCMTIFKEAG